MANHDIKWAAGFFEGEGHTGFHWRYHKNNPRKYGRLKIEISQCHVEPLNTFKDILGCGSVTGPYGPYQANKKPYYLYTASGAEAQNAIEQMMPLLFQKAEQARGAIKTYQEYNNGK